MSWNQSTIPQVVGQCPACKVDLTVAVQVVFDDITVGDGQAVGTGKVTGAKTVEHNCIPRVTRG